MPLPNEWSLQLALVAIAEADLGPGGLVELCGGNAHPLLEFGDEGRERRPIVTVHIQAEPGGGTDSPLAGDLQFDAWVNDPSRGLEFRLLDRIVERMTTARLAEQGLDIVIRWRERPDLSDLTDRGKRRAQRAEFTMWRAAVAGA